MKELWYRQSAACWEETLPLGCGSLGAMVWGNPREEKIGFNHELLWSGTGTTDHSDRHHHAKELPMVREWIRQGEYQKAERYMEEHFLDEYTESYMPAGDLRIFMGKADAEVKDYRRSLVLDTATAYSSFCMDGVSVEREMFISHPEKSFFFQQTADQKTDMTFLFETQEIFVSATREKDHTLACTLRLPEHVDPNYLGERENAIIYGTGGMEYTVRIHVLECDGDFTILEGEQAKIEVKDAAKVVLSVSILEEALDETKSYEEHLKGHIEDYRRLYQRSELEIGEEDHRPTDERLKDPDPGLYALYYQYGRYLLISSSRKGGLPATLQGIWNWQMRAPWSSNYTTNINLQMNYWPALVANLEECDEVYIDFIKRICEEGRKTAAAFGCKGSCCGHNTDGYAHTYPVGVARGEEGGNPSCLMWAFYLMAEVWMDQEVYRKYQYHPDRTYLKETVYPLLKASCEFVTDYLSLQDGYYVTSPSTTPENRFETDGFKVSASFATTMDMTMIRELFRNYRWTIRDLKEQGEAEKEGIELLQKIETIEPRLYPVHFNRDGSVCEWFEEQTEIEKGHRHVSHLYGLFPSDLWRQDESMKKAVRKTLENRMAAGGGHTGWSLSWILNLYTLLEDKEMVSQYLKQMFERSTYPNLWDKHPPFQIDGNFGMTVAIAHMLVEEKEEEIRLLPCLPEEWTKGEVKGLCLPGNRVVSFKWEEGKVVENSVLVEAYQR